MVENWLKKISIQATIGLTQPQVVYSCFVSGYQLQFSFTRTMPGMGLYLQPTEEMIRHQLIPDMNGGGHLVNDNNNDNGRSLLSLPPRMGDLGLKITKSEQK